MYIRNLNSQQGKLDCMETPLKEGQLSVLHSDYMLHLGQ
jgi:hypothetical protein